MKQGRVGGSYVIKDCEIVFHQLLRHPLSGSLIAGGFYFWLHIKSPGRLFKKLRCPGLVPDQLKQSQEWALALVVPGPLREVLRCGYGWQAFGQRSCSLLLAGSQSSAPQRAARASWLLYSPQPLT